MFESISRHPDFHGLARSAMAAAIIVVIAMFAIRLTMPSDIWHQTQPKTISYTTDIIVNGRWMLPVERDEYPATKPPLYNWIAVPFVAAAGFDAEIAHKMPSILAMIAMSVMIVLIAAKRLAINNGIVLGAGALIMLASEYPMAKLAYLARPDMLLTLFLCIAWWAASEVLVAVRGEKRESPNLTRWVVLFWCAVACAWLAKGPPALVAVGFAFLGAKLVAGRWSAIHRFRWWWGVPLSLLPFAGWVLGAYLHDAEHVVGQLWGDELLGRIVGTGEEAPDEGFKAFLTGLLDMPAYYLLRSAPWSFISVAAIVEVVRQARRSRAGEERDVPSRLHLVMRSAAIWTVLVVVTFSLSAGKRADYIASAYPTGALLAAWMVVRWFVDPPRGRLGSLRAFGAVTGVTVIALAILTGIAVIEWREPAAPEPRYGERMNAFYRSVNEHIDADSADRTLYMRGCAMGHDWAFLGAPREVDVAELTSRLAAGESFYLVEGRVRTSVIPLPRIPVVRAQHPKITTILTSPTMTKTSMWPHHMTLYFVEPG